MERESYVVIVTYGNVPGERVYARAWNMRDAKALHRAALERHYTDARVERESDFQAAQEAYRRSQAYSRWTPAAAS